MGLVLGEVYKPEDLDKGRLKPSRDIPYHVDRLTIESLLEEVRRLSEEVEKIKRTLERHGIEVH